MIGANGSGKSTFARLLNGLVVPAQGRVRIDGLDTVRDARAIRRRVGFCFTDPDAQIVMPTVAEDVAFGLRRLKLPTDQVQRRVGDGAGRAGLADHADHPAHLLSGGQKQLLALTSVLVTEPDLLVLDEPTTLLDLRNTRRIAAVVDGLPQQVVLVTHDLDLLDGVRPGARLRRRPAGRRCGPRRGGRALPAADESGAGPMIGPTIGPTIAPDLP